MDRQIVYPGQVPYEADLLNTNRYALIGVSKLMEALVGPISTAQVAGFGVTLNNLAVTVATGQIYSPTTVDNVAYSSLATDTNPLIKQGIAWGSQTLNVSAAPAQSGGANQERIDVIAVSFSEVDEDSSTLQYFNSADPSTPISGAPGTGAAQNRKRAGKAVVTKYEGTPANVGSATAPSIPAGSVQIYQVRLATGTTSLGIAASASANGVYKNEAVWVSVGSGTGGQLTSAMQTTGHSLWAQLANAGNTFSGGVQIVNFNDPEPLVVRGGTTSAGTGIKLIDDDSSESAPNKYLRSKDGNFVIQNSAKSADIFTLTDTGTATITTGVVLGNAQGTLSDDETLITKGYADGRYTSTVGYIPSADYIGGGGTNKVIDASSANTQTLAGKLALNTTVWGSFSDNEFVTKKAVNDHFGMLGGLDEAGAKAICLPLQPAAAVTVASSDVTHNVTFSGAAPKTTVAIADINSAGTQALITKGYGDATYMVSSTSSDGVLSYLTLSSTPTDAQTTRAASVGYVLNSFAKKSGSTYTGSHDFTGATITIPAGTASTAQPATMTQVASMIATELSGTSSSLLGASNSWTGANSFTSAGSVTFANAPTLNSNPHITDGGASLMNRGYADGRYLMLDKGANASTVTIKTPFKLHNAINEPRLATASGEPVVYDQLADLINKTVASSMDELLTFKKNADISHATATSHSLTFKNAAASLTYDQSNANLSLRIGSTDVFSVNSGGPQSALPLVIHNTITTNDSFGNSANISSGGNLSADIGPTNVSGGDKVAVRPADWTYTGGSNATGSVRHPKGQTGGLRQYWTKVTTNQTHNSYWKKASFSRPSGWTTIVNAQCTVAYTPGSSVTDENATVNVSGTTVTVYTQQQRAVYVLLTGF